MQIIRVMKVIKMLKVDLKKIGEELREYKEKYEAEGLNKTNTIMKNITT